MDINIRRAVKDNLNHASTEDVRKTIMDAIQIGEEKVLPGLGVLFELLWQKADATYQNQIVTSICEALQ